jgi:fusicocca-2,10(14)-diene synthase/ophiobolin F synthase
MDSALSSLIHPSAYDFKDLCDSLPVRISKLEHLANKGALRAQEDWKRYVGPLNNFHGCMSKYNVVALAIPECLPDRLEAITYVNEFAFLYDGT